MKARSLFITGLLALSLILPAAGEGVGHPLIDPDLFTQDESVESVENSPGNDWLSEDAPVVDEGTDNEPFIPLGPGPAPSLVEDKEKESPSANQAQPRNSSAPTPQMLESVYRQVWQQVAQSYFDVSQLRDWDKWADKYDGQLNTVEDLENALVEMLSSLNERWTKYVPTSHIEAQRAAAQAGILDLGITLTAMPDGRVLVDYLDFGSVGYKSPLRRGQEVLSIDGQDLSGKSQHELDEMLKGKLDETRTIEFVHNGAKRKVTLTFAPSEPNAGEARLLPGDIIYIRFPSFNDNQFQAFLNALAQAHSSAKGSPRGLILDLRGNSGGAVSVALNMLSLFVEKGVVFTSTTREGRMVKHDSIEAVPPQAHDFLDMDSDMISIISDLHKVPMVVLVNGSSASSSEIVTGALKDNARATVIGMTTYGKGVGYIGRRLPPGGFLTITTLSYRTPSGFDLSNRGITPDIVIDDIAETKLDEQLARAVEVINAKSANPLDSQGDEKHKGNEGWSTNPLIISGSIAAFLLLLAIAFRHFQLQQLRRRKEMEANEPEEKERY